VDRSSRTLSSSSLVRDKVRDKVGDKGNGICDAENVRKARCFLPDIRGYGMVVIFCEEMCNEKRL